MDNVCPQRVKTLKRISGSQLVKKVFPLKKPRRLFNNMMRFSKIDELPRISFHKVTRSVPVVLDASVLKDGKRDSKLALANDSTKGISNHKQRISQRKVVFNCELVRQIS